MSTSARVPSTLRRYWEDDPALLAVLAVTFVGLLARLLWLGARTAHFDEARVAYWTLRYMKTGTFEYRFIIHGPFIQHVNTWVWTVLGADDFTLRLAVALVGAALPLLALLFREHLHDREVALMALFLALNPVVLYYSRFLRSDLLVAFFMVGALGLFVRFLDTRRVRYLYASGAFVAFGFASKENAIVYLLCYVGAAALLADTGLFRPRTQPHGAAVLGDRWTRFREWALSDPRHARRTLQRYAGHVLGVGLLVGVLTVFFYAPRAGDAGGVGLYQIAGNPAVLPDVLGATAQDIDRALNYWFGRSSDPGCHKDNLVDGYVCYLGRFLHTMGSFAAPVSVFSIGGFLVERYGRERPRRLVMFASYWGFVSVLGYPLATDIWAAWVTVHAIVPLAIPAAVGLGVIVGWGGDAWRAEDSTGVALSAVLVVLVVVGMAWTGVATAYLDPQGRDSPSDMVQYAQPQHDMKPGIHAMERAVAGHQGVDVLWYGDQFYVSNESDLDYPPPVNRSPTGTTSGWFKRLPMPWYTERMDAEVASVRTADALEAAIGTDPPPVIIASTEHAELIESRIDGYVTFTYDMRAPTEGTSGSTVVIFVDESRL